MNPRCVNPVAERPGGIWNISQNSKSLLVMNCQCGSYDEMLGVVFRDCELMIDG